MFYNKCHLTADRMAKEARAFTWRAPEFGYVRTGFLLFFFFRLAAVVQGIAQSAEEALSTRFEFFFVFTTASFALCLQPI